MHIYLNAFGVNCYCIRSKGVIRPTGFNCYCARTKDLSTVVSMTSLIYIWVNWIWVNLGQLDLITLGVKKGTQSDRKS